jgi:archaellum biogenesis protein FlaJ (TadC family)
MHQLVDIIIEWRWTIGFFSFLMFVGTLLLIPILLIRLPADYFIRQPIKEWHSNNRLLHWILIILKNLLGLILIAMGIAMLVLPGQGLLTILLGIVLMDFPGKRKFERRLIDYKPLRESANWLRARNGKPPFVL